MKKSMFLLTMALSLMVLSCKKESVVNNTTGQPAVDAIILKTNQAAVGVPNNVTPKVLSVLTRVGSYINDGVDETAWFKPYLFEFRIDNSVVATSPESMDYGKWMFSAPDKMELLFDFEVVKINGLSFLNGVWSIVEISPTHMLLVSPVNDSNGGGSREKVRFIRFDLVN